MDKISGYLSSFSSQVNVIAAPLAGTILVILGLSWMLVKDEQKKHSLVSWMINVIIGFAIVFAGTSIVSWFGQFIN